MEKQKDSKKKKKHIDGWSIFLIVFFLLGIIGVIVAQDFQVDKMSNHKNVYIECLSTCSQGSHNTFMEKQQLNYCVTNCNDMYKQLRGIYG